MTIAFSIWRVLKYYNDRFWMFKCTELYSIIPQRYLSCHGSTEKKFLLLFAFAASGSTRFVATRHNDAPQSWRKPILALRRFDLFQNDQYAHLKQKQKKPAQRSAEYDRSETTTAVNPPQTTKTPRTPPTTTRGSGGCFPLESRLAKDGIYRCWVEFQSSYRSFPYHRIQWRI